MSLSEVCAECLRTSNWGCTHLAKPDVDDWLDSVLVSLESRTSTIAATKAALLELSLGCLPEKMKVPDYGNFDGKGWLKYGSAIAHNEAIDLMEHKLREVFGG